jgi:hypothetical protein
MRCSSFNLQAGVPSWRPFICSTAAFCVTPSPSGLVPSDGVDGHGVELVIFIGGEGLDCFFQFFANVLFIRAEGLFLFSFFFESLNVIFILPINAA